MTVRGFRQERCKNDHDMTDSKNVHVYIDSKGMERHYCRACRRMYMSGYRRTYIPPRRRSIALRNTAQKLA